MAVKTKRPPDQATRRPGKHAIGWKKVGVYLSPEASERLSLHSIRRKEDWSTILNHLVTARIPAYTITVKAGAGGDPAAPVDTDDRHDLGEEMRQGSGTAA